MKCYVLTVSQFFPKDHPRSGEPTSFREAIHNSGKIHTIRGNYELWKKRFEKIENGDAYLSVRAWSGKPYKSEQIELFRFDKSHGIGIEKIQFREKMHHWYINGVYKKLKLLRIASNDGLSVSDFLAWFNGYPTKEMAVIHFTKFRYGKV